MLGNVVVTDLRLARGLEPLLVYRVAANPLNALKFLFHLRATFCFPGKCITLALKIFLLYPIKSDRGHFQMYSSPTTSSKSFRIGIICGSQRKPRVGDQITDFVYEILKLHSSSIRNTITLEFDYIDIGALSLPFYDEPGIPSKITSAEGYTHEHTRVWSRRVAALDAFVFVTPQYNWGVPGGLKNAIDLLYNEWKGKPAIIVSYGGHGGGKAAASLKLCLAGGIDMQIGDRMVVNLSFPNREVLYKAAKGEQLGLSATKDGGIWSSERKRISSACDEMVGMLMAQGAAKVALHASQKFNRIRLAFQK